MRSDYGMSLVYIFAASRMEAEPVRKITAFSKDQSPARCGENEVVLMIGGMGPQNARNKAEAVLGKTPDGCTAPKPHAVLVIGLCGGLTESLSEGRIVAYTACGSTEAAKPLLSCSESIVNSFVRQLSSSGIECDRRVGVTSARIATTRDERLALARSGADVVDMESYPIMECAASAAIPAAVLRVVSDSMDRVLPNLNRALNGSGGLDGRKAFMVAVGSPVRTAKLLAANKRAMQRLSTALGIVVKAPCFA